MEETRVWRRHGYGKDSKMEGARVWKGQRHVGDKDMGGYVYRGTWAWKGQWYGGDMDME